MIDFLKNTKDEVPAFYELSLKKVIINGNVFGKYGDFTIEQVFVNNRTKPLEVNYTFPITETAVVTGFEVRVGEKVMHGVCKEKEEAKKEYVENLAKGNSAYMLNQDTANVFDVMVGKVLPKEEVHIVISYLDFYEAVDNNIRLIIPTLVNQRYKSKITDGLQYGKVEYTVDFNIKINKTLQYTSIESVNHKIERKDEEDYISITADNYDMSKDFVLDMKFKDAQMTNACYYDTKDGNKAVLLSLMPEIEDYEDSEKEYIFVVDKSGSMASSGKMEKTKEALKRCLRELDAGDKFNILPFERAFTFYKEESVEANEKNIEDAVKYIDTLRANGGTEILNPIRFALYDKSDDKVVIVLTDGEVGNEDEIVDFISKNIYNSKLFAFGIDTSVNTAFIKAMAVAGNGKAEFIYPNEKMDDSIVRTFARIQSPLMRDVKIDFGKNKLIEQVRQDGTLFNYEFFQISAILADLVDDVKINCSVNNKNVSWTIEKESIAKTDNSAIELIYAKRQMDYYEELIRSYTRDRRNIRVKEMIDEYKAKIIELSTKYSISSKYTSFISVNEREEKVFESTVFENVTLSNKEIKTKSTFGGFNGRTARIQMDSDESVNMYYADRLCAINDISQAEIEIRKALQTEIGIESFDDWKNMDIYTFLLGLIYLYKHGDYSKIDKIFVEYINEHREELKEENVQRLLTYLYQEYILPKDFIEDLLVGLYKKIANTNATYKIDIKKLDYGEDTSKQLSNGKTLRKEILERI